MYSLLFLACLPGQFVENPLFPKEKQDAAFNATVRTYHEASRSAGTAVIVARKDDKSYLLTAAHLVPEQAIQGREKSDIRSVELFLYNAKEPTTVSHGVARVVVRMPNEDLALLEAVLPNPPDAAPLCPKDKLIMKFPLTVLTIGTLPDGPPDIIVDQVRRQKWIKKPDKTEANYYEADIPQGPGRSGGPMIDSRGYVIGIASGTENGKGYYICIEEIHRALAREQFSWLYEKPAAKK
jgi:S1-C subfamily serine protease